MVFIECLNSITGFISFLSLILTGIIGWFVAQNAWLQKKVQVQNINENKKAKWKISLIQPSNKSYRISLQNIGKVEAREINLHFPDGYGWVSESDYNNKFPMKVIQPEQVVNLLASLELRCKKKLLIHIEWSDDNQDDNEQIFEITL